MHYVAGESLQQRLDREGPLELCEILRIGLQTAAGLAAAHAQGLVHRDVKPSNILLEHGIERTLLTDFGLARASDDASVTLTGYHPGTPQYMSPEQARGDAVDARSDLFSLGSVLYAMCTGRSPFRAETTYGILRRITDSEPRPVREVNPAIPQWLERCIFKLLSKTATERFQSAEQVADLLRDCLAHVQQPTTVDLPRECRLPARWKLASRLSRTSVAVISVTTLCVAGLLSFAIIGAPWPERTNGTALPALRPALSASDETRSDWEATSTEFRSFDQDLKTFESQAEPLWDEPSESIHSDILRDAIEPR